MTFLLSLLGNWRVLAGLALAALLAGVVFKITSLEHKLQASQQILEQERKNNVVLRDNADKLAQVNAENAKIFDQQVTNARATAAAIKNLSTVIAQNNGSVNDLKNKIDQIKTPPAPLSPYIAEGVRGVQNLRGQEVKK